MHADKDTATVKLLTSVYQFEAFAGSRPITIELNPQMVGGTVDDVGHFALCKIAQQSWRTVLSIINL